MRRITAKITPVARVFKGGRCVSFRIDRNGKKQTIGVFLRRVTFTTEGAEVISITHGILMVRIQGSRDILPLLPGAQVTIPARTKFTADPESGPVSYICTFL